MDDCFREVDKSEEELKKKVYVCYANEIAWWNYADRVLTLIWVSHFAMVFVFWDDEYVAMKSLIIAFIAMIICFSGLSRKVGELRYIARLIKNGEFFLLDCKICDVKKDIVNDTYSVTIKLKDGFENMMPVKLGKAVVDRVEGGEEVDVLVIRVPYEYSKERKVYYMVLDKGSKV